MDNDVRDVKRLLDNLHENSLATFVVAGPEIGTTETRGVLPTDVLKDALSLWLEMRSSNRCTPSQPKKASYFPGDQVYCRTLGRLAIVVQQICNGVFEVWAGGEPSHLAAEADLQMARTNHLEEVPGWTKSGTAWDVVKIPPLGEKDCEEKAPTGYSLGYYPPLTKEADEPLTVEAVPDDLQDAGAVTGGR